MNREPAYGVGLAYRRMFHDDIMRCRNDIDFLELPTVEYLERMRRIAADPLGKCIQQARKTFPCVGHGISMSIGSVGEPETDLLMQTRDFMDQYQINEFSDHLTFHRMGDKDLSVFMSMPFDRASADWIASQYNRSKEILGGSFGLEIVTYPFVVPGSELTEVEFVNRVAEKTDCWLLLDVANLFYNSSNHGYDPIEFLDQIDGDRVQHLHVAGGHQDDDQWIDSHNEPVHEEVFELLEAVMEKTAARAITLERDEEPEHFSSIVDDLRRTKDIFLKYRPETIPDDLLRNGPPTFEPLVEAELIELDALPDDIEGLRRYQEALVECSFALADGNFHNRAPEDVLDDYQMTSAWQSRWKDMRWNVFKKLSYQVRSVQEFDEQAAHYSKIAELHYWANKRAGFM